MLPEDWERYRWKDDADELVECCIGVVVGAVSEIDVLSAHRLTPNTRRELSIAEIANPSRSSASIVPINSLEGVLAPTPAHNVGDRAPGPFSASVNERGSVNWNEMIPTGPPPD